jgi:hypothetical protein
VASTSSCKVFARCRRTTAWSGRGMSKAPFQIPRQRAAQAGRWALFQVEGFGGR